MSEVDNCSADFQSHSAFTQRDKFHELARKLERERDELREEMESEKRWAAQYKIERDAALQDRDAWAGLCGAEDCFTPSSAKPYIEVSKERDELRAEVAEWRNGTRYLPCEHLVGMLDFAKQTAEANKRADELREEVERLKADRNCEKRMRQDADEAKEQAVAVLRVMDGVVKERDELREVVKDREKKVELAIAAEEEKEHENCKLRAEVERLKADKARLDFLSEKDAKFAATARTGYPTMLEG